MGNKAAIYVRVSTSSQKTAPQESELRVYAQRRQWQITEIYKDNGYSGSTQERPALQRMLRDCRRGEFSILLVWKIDRLARSLRDLIATVEFLRSHSVSFCSYTENVDTTGPAGEMVFHVFGAVAQFERSLIKERVCAGIAEARSKGKRIGRPETVKLSPRLAKEVQKGRGRGESLRGLARSHKLSVWGVQKALNR